MNKAIISGNLGKDPEIKYTQSGKAVCQLSVGVNSGWGDKKRTDWLPVIVWDKAAEACGNSLTKGSKVLVEGRIQTRSYDASDGSKRYVTEIVANEVEFLSKRKEQGNEQPSPLDDCDVPF